MAESNGLKKEALMVTTVHKGVFFGYGVYENKPEIELERARMVIYWVAENHGVLGMASDGPAAGSRISPPAPSLLLRDVTSIAKVSARAVKEWETGKWS